MAPKKPRGSKKGEVRKTARKDYVMPKKSPTKKK